MSKPTQRGKEPRHASLAPDISHSVCRLPREMILDSCSCASIQLECDLPHASSLLDLVLCQCIQSLID